MLFEHVSESKFAAATSAFGFTVMSDPPSSFREPLKNLLLLLLPFSGGFVPVIHSPVYLFVHPFT